MAHLTGNFTSESPLSAAVRDAISAAFEQGWADPKKLSQAAGRAAILADSAKTEIAQGLHTSSANFEVLGEPNLAHFIAIGGYLSDSSRLITSTIDLGKIRAIARARQQESEMQGVDHHGAILQDGLKLNSHSVLSLQAANGETGVEQNLEPFRGSAGHVIVDATRSLPHRDVVSGFSATTFEAHSWGGPLGIGFIAISDAKNFRYPLPHIAPIRVPGSYSLPLLIGSAIALEEVKDEIAALARMRLLLGAKLQTIEGITVLGMELPSQSRYLSIIVDGLASEEILRSLLRRDISVDAGSACSPEDLTPSHVIASMGYPTTGHLRFTIHAGTTEAELDHLVSGLTEVLRELRS